MTFREKLVRGRSHLLIVVVMIITAITVVATEDSNLSKETGKAPPKDGLHQAMDHAEPLNAAPAARPASSVPGD